MESKIELLISPEALNDLEEIFKYTLENWSYEQAQNYHNEINCQFLELTLYPKLGQAYIYKSGNYRILKVNRHLIFYKLKDEYCIIMRILHERMDLNLNLL